MGGEVTERPPPLVPKWTSCDRVYVLWVAVSSSLSSRSASGNGGWGKFVTGNRSQVLIFHERRLTSSSPPPCLFKIHCSKCEAVVLFVSRFPFLTISISGIRVGFAQVLPNCACLVRASLCPFFLAKVVRNLPAPPRAELSILFARPPMSSNRRRSFELNDLTGLFLLFAREIHLFF